MLFKCLGLKPQVKKWIDLLYFRAYGSFDAFSRIFTLSNLFLKSISQIFLFDPRDKARGNRLGDCI